MIKNINIKIEVTGSIRPYCVRDKMEICFHGDTFRNNFEVLSFIDCSDYAGRFLCTYGGDFFTIPIEHTKKI